MKQLLFEKSRFMTVHIWKTTVFIISVSKFEQYLSENCGFHMLLYHRYRIVSYRFFVSILQSRPSLFPAITTIPQFASCLNLTFVVAEPEIFLTEMLFCAPSPLHKIGHFVGNAEFSDFRVVVEVCSKGWLKSWETNLKIG